VKCEISPNLFAKILHAPGEIAEIQIGDKEQARKELPDLKEEEDEEEFERFVGDDNDDEASAIHRHDSASDVEVLCDANGYALERASPYYRVTTD
jgi:hypothetical protein